ncbi:MAG: nucleotide-binding protein [Melioribacteraceae bacterium]|nr:nucleotide-binding protein [Melioribacteraceae bacterium]
MGNNLPRIFIGSSSENLDAAYAIQENFEFDAICNVWTQGIFNLTNDALENLLKATENFDYAIFVFSPDDITKVRGIEVKTVRDNIIFEFGLFISKLGKEKVFFVIPKDTKDFHLPTDLLGIEPGRYVDVSEKTNLLGSLGPFCNKVRRLLKPSSKEKIKLPPKESSEEIAEMNSSQLDNEVTEIDYGISVDNFNNKIITRSPTDIFSYRFAKAFPGNRSLEWIDDPIKAIDRLEILLKKPLKFEKAMGYGVTTDPFWWFRGHKDLYIDKFERLSESRCLMDIYELNIKRIASFNGGGYWQSFVYVETKADSPIGVYSYSKEDFENYKSRDGILREEFGLFENIPITRECYDDGAAEINGKITDTAGAELRARYLTDFNFIIASKFSPTNSKMFRNFSNEFYKDVLNENSNLKILIDFFLTLPRHDKED